MTAATGEISTIEPYSEEAIPRAMLLGLAGSVAPRLGWLLAVNASGYLTPQAAGVAGLLPYGFADRRSDGDPDDGDATMVCRQIVASGHANSTGAADALLATDLAVPAWAVDNATFGRKSNLAGSNRSLGGLAMGIDRKGRPIVYHGPIGGLLARGAMIADAVLLGTHSYLVDAGAATDLTEIQFSNPRAKLHGLITGIEYIPNATLAATGVTDFKTLTVTKYAADGSTPVVVGTMTTVLVQTKWVAKAFTLSAVAHALEVLEGDTFTIQNSHGGNGAVTPTGVIRINGRAL